MSDSTRIGNLAHLDMLKHVIEVRRREVARLQLQAATGKRMQGPSDDPPAAARAASLKLQLASNEQLTGSVNDALSWIDSSETAVSIVRRIVEDARLLALQGANDTQSPESRQVLADRVDQLLEELADTSTLKRARDHIFAGERFDIPPYTFTRDGDGKIIGVTAAANIDGRVERLVDQDMRVTVNVSPSDVFGVDDPSRVDLFDTLIQVRDALESSDQPAVASLVDALESAEDQVISELSALGAVTVQLDNLIERLDRRQLSLDISLSETEDADLAETLIELQNQETVLEAALSATARVQQLSLFDFI